jgi:signal transduction histidine kinase
MKLKYKVNLLSLGVLLIVASAISAAGVLTIQGLTYRLNRKLMSSEVSHIVDRIRAAHTVLIESGVADVDSYVFRAQGDLLAEFSDYRFGKTGELLILAEPGLRQVHPQLLSPAVIDFALHKEILEKKKGVSECPHSGQNRFFFFESFPEWRWVIVLSVRTSELLAERDAFLRKVIVILAIGLIIGCLAFFWFTDNLVGPIQQFSEAALAISRGGWDQALPRVRARDEVGDLSRAFEEMSRRLATAYGELERKARELQTSNAKLHHEITEHMKTGQQLQKLNQELEQRVVERTGQLQDANRELEAFSYSVSHDLRAPLRSIHGFSQALLEDYGEVLDAEGREFLQRVRRASQRMAQLIDDLLKLSRITGGEMVRDPVDLSRLAAMVVEELRQENPGRGTEVVIQPGVWAEGDGRLLRVALENLFGNAWKFTSLRENARIEFGTVDPVALGQGQVGRMVYFVRDNGVGFDPAYADKLFGVFQRLHLATEFPGTGIGLATVQRIIHRHRGRIWAEGALNEGATFYFTLPRAS